jgi:hypothetical protein
MTIKTILQPRRSNYQRLSTAISPGKLTKLKRSRKSLISTLSTLFPTTHHPQKTVEVETSTTTTPAEDNQTDHSPQEIMKVKELKNWLQDFGEKNTEHFRRSRDHRSPNKENEEDSLVLLSKPSTATTISSSNSSPDSKSPREELDMRFCHRSHGNLPTKTSPVNASPISSCDEKYYPATQIPSEDYDSALLSEKITSNASGPTTVTPSCSCSCDEAGAEAEITSIKENTSSDPTETTTDETEDANELYPVVTTSWDSENNVGGSWDFSEANFSDESNVALFEDYDDFDDFDSSSPGTGRLSEPRSSQPNPIDYQRRCTFGGIQGMDNMGNDHVELLRSQNPVGKLLNVENDDSGDIHLLDKETNPSSTSTMHNANIFGNKTLTSSTLDFICNNGQVDKSKQAKFNETTIDLSDEGTASSASQDSAQPSIAPDAMESKLVRQFFDANNDISQVTARPAKADTATSHSAQPTIARATRKKLDPKDLPFLQHKPVPKSVPLPPQTQSPKTAVGLGIRKYGGPRKTIVERRTEQLEKKWSESKSAKHVTKIKWGVCHKTGTYKKKVVLDVQY